MIIAYGNTCVNTKVRRQGTVLCLLFQTLDITGFLKGDREPSPVSLKIGLANASPKNLCLLVEFSLLILSMKKFM